MAEEHKGFLDDTSLSKTPRSPLKTSTAAKENIKWRDFHKRQAYFEADSLFIPGEESFSALHEVTNVQKFSVKNQNPTCHVNNSFISDGANSSLGILHTDKLNDLTQSSMDLAFNSDHKRKSKLSSKVIKLLDTENKQSSWNIKDGILSADIDTSINDLDPVSGSSSSSDIEYDGTNIPELNLDFTTLNSKLIESASKLVESSFYDSLKHTIENAENDPELFNKNNSLHHKTFEMRTSESTKQSTSRQSIFENFHPQYDSIFKQLMPQKEFDSFKSDNIPEKIKVCPFLDVSSFEIEPVLLKKDFYENNNKLNAVNTDHEESSLDFCPEQISARSSSFKSSIKAASNTCEECNPSIQKSVNYMVAEKDCEHLRDEVLTGSILNNIEGNSSKSSENPMAEKGMKDSKSFAKEESVVLPEKEGLDMQSKDLAFHYDFHNEPSALIAEGEKWSSRLGISESEFFSSDIAKQMLKKDTEMFEKEHMFEAGNESKRGSSSTWSPPSQNDITPPSWFTELCYNREYNSNRHVSIGTLISARTENLGTLSEDLNRERPFFGSSASTPVRNPSKSISCISEYPEVNSSNSTACETEASILKGPGSSNESSNELLRASTLSQLLNDISSSDPVRMASKIFGKYVEKEVSKSDTLEKGKYTKANDQYLLGKNTFIVADSTKSTSKLNTVLKDSENALMKQSISNFVKSSENVVDEECKFFTPIETTQCSLDRMLDFSSVTVNEKCSDKIAKSKTCANCNLASEQSIPQTSSRPLSSCSNVSSNPSTVQNVVYAQHGCMKYYGPSQEQCHQNMVPAINLLHQPISCSHCYQHSTCSQHTGMSNTFPFKAQSFQQVHQAPIPGSSLPLIISGSGILYSGLMGPDQLNFPEKICIGDSQQMNLTIQNNYGNFYHISYLSASINNSPFPAEMSGVGFDKIIPASNGNTTNIQFTLSPKYEGKVQVDLNIVALTSPVEQAFSVIPGASLKTRILYEAMHPSVFLVCKEKDSLDLGHVIAGCTIMEYITVINQSEVTVPLRISLSSDVADNHMQFGIKEMDRKRYPNTAGFKFLSPKVILYCLPASKTKPATSHLDIPVIFEAGKNVADVNFTVTAAIETPLLSETLSFIRISASVGLSKLVLKDHMNSLSLKAKDGCVATQDLTVINQGTLHCVYDLQIECDSDCFAISPSTLNLHPLESCKITISYSALSHLPVKGYLQAAAQPYGNVSCVLEIFGEVLKNSHFIPKFNTCAKFQPATDLKSCKGSRNSSDILSCNKKYIAWGGVDIGSTVSDSFTIRNVSAADLKIKLYMKGKPDFKFINESTPKQNSLILKLGSNEERNIYVAFTPNEASASSALVAIKTLTSTTVQQMVFSISLSGYGGTGHLKVLDLPVKEGSGYCMEIDATNENTTIHNNIVVHNPGFRAVFVKAVVFFDGLLQNQVEKCVEIHPSEFILLENEKKNLLVLFNFDDKRDFSNFGVISLMYGDEIMRQLLRKSKCFGISGASQNYEKFCPRFEGEERVPYDPSYITTPRDLSLFQSNLKTVMIHLFLNQRSMSMNEITFGALSEIQDCFSTLTINETTYSRRLTSPITIGQGATPVKVSTLDNINRLSLPKPSFGDPPSKNPSSTNMCVNTADKIKEAKFDYWSVKPQELILDSDNKDNRILLINHSRQDLRFKIEYAIDVISVSPVSGVLPAKGNIGLRVTIISYSLGKLSEDYQECIKVLCGGVEKAVLVKVIKVHKNQKSFIVPNFLISKGSEKSISSEDFSAENVVMQNLSSTIFVDNAHQFPKYICLKSTTPRILSETILIVHNPDNMPIQWRFNPISMVFGQSLEDSITEMGSIIQFSLSGGTFQPKKLTKIVIGFLPTTTGHFSQFYEFFLNLEGGAEQKFNIKVEGCAFSCLQDTAKDGKDDFLSCTIEGPLQIKHLPSQNCVLPSF